MEKLAKMNNLPPTKVKIKNLMIPEGHWSLIKAPIKQKLGLKKKLFVPKIDKKNDDCGLINLAKLDDSVISESLWSKSTIQNKWKSSIWLSS